MEQVDHPWRGIMRQIQFGMTKIIGLGVEAPRKFERGVVHAGAMAIGCSGYRTAAFSDDLRSKVRDCHGDH